MSGNAEVKINSMSGTELHVTVQYSRKFYFRVWLCLALIKLAVLVGGFDRLETEQVVTE